MLPTSFQEREDPSAAQMKEAYESLLKREQVYVKVRTDAILFSNPSHHE